MRLTPLLIALALLPSPVAVADQLATPAPPRILSLAQRVGSGDMTATLEVVDQTGKTTPVLDQLPLGGMSLGVHQATGRWAMTFFQLSNGDPLQLDGKAVSKPDDRNTLVLGDLTGVISHAYGDKGCTSKKKACFETPVAWSDDGAYVFVESLGSSWGTIGRWNFGKKPKRAVITAKKPGTLMIAPGGKRAAYVGKDGVHVVTFPKAKKKAAKIKPTKQAVVAPDLLMSSVYPIGDRLYWFRREPTEQKQGWFEAYDLVTKQTITLLEAPTEFYMMRGGFLSTGPRATVLFGVDAEFERADIYEVGADGKATVIARDVAQLLDVSADGRYVLVTRRKEPKKGNVPGNTEQLVIIDLDTRRDAQVSSGSGDQILDAGFVPAT